jgi:hypothetical protein
MSPADLIITAVLLGLFVAAGGAYGILFAAAQLRGSAQLARVAQGCYMLQLLIALAVCFGSPLALVWKLFIVASAAAYGFIPPLMWRLLDAMHRGGKETRFP